MRAASIVLRALAAAAIAVALLGVPLLALQAPPVTAVLVGRYYDPDTGGLPVPVALRTAEAVRRYTTDPAAPPLPATVGGRAGFDEAAASHLRDVRRVLRAADAATLALIAALAVALALAWRRRALRDIAWVLRAGAAAMAIAVAVVAGWALGDFDAFFTAFHQLFFASGTWTFPYGTLLIELFPEPLWATLGALWAAGVLGGAVIALVAAHALAGRER